MKPPNYTTMPTKDLRPYENNPRKNDNAVHAVAESIKEFGFRQPIVVQEDGTIICGHTRWKAAKKLGMKDVPVHVVTDLTPEQIKAYRIADNSTRDLSDWDDALLLDEISAILDIDMSKFGITLNIDGDVEATDDGFVPEIPEEATTKVGDIYKLGEHILMCGDSTSAHDAGRLITAGGGARGSLLFTDPPWNVAYGSTENPKWKNRQIENDDMPEEQFFAFLETAFSVCSDVLADGAIAYVVLGIDHFNTLTKAMEERYHRSSVIIWVKQHFVLGRKDYHSRYEPIYYGWKKGAERIHPLKERDQDDVWEFDRPMKSDDHPTMKPIPLIAKAVQNSSNKGDIVLDMFGGSGSTMIACEQTGRKCRMMELDPHYCDVIVRRWEEFTGKKAELLP